jgi:hypothetical protein
LSKRQDTPPLPPPERKKKRGRRATTRKIQTENPPKLLPASRLDGLGHSRAVAEHGIAREPGRARQADDGE